MYPRLAQSEAKRVDDESPEPPVPRDGDIVRVKPIRFDSYHCLLDNKHPGAAENSAFRMRGENTLCGLGIGLEEKSKSSILASVGHLEGMRKRGVDFGGVASRNPCREL